jgi:hypothetical protein
MNVKSTILRLIKKFTNKQLLFGGGFLMILVLAVFLRFYQLGSIPSSLYWDEVAMLVDARLVQATGQDLHQNHWFQAIFPSYGDFKLPVYIWMSAIAIFFQGYQEVVVRLPSALAGVLTVLLSGAIAWQGTKKRSVVLASMLVVATAPWSIIFSRSGFEAHFAQFLLGASVFLQQSGLKIFNSKQDLKFSKIIYFLVLILLSIMVGTASIYTYFSVRFVWPIVWIAGFVFFQVEIFKTQQLGVNIKSGSDLWNFFFNSSATKKLLKFKTILVTLSLMFAGLMLNQILLIPMYQSQLYQISNTFRLTAPSILNRYDYALDSNVLREQSINDLNQNHQQDSQLDSKKNFFVFDYSLINQTLPRFWYHRHWLLVRTFFSNLSQQIDLSFWFIKGDSNLRHGTGQHGLFVLPLLVPAMIGLLTLAKSNKNLLVFLSLWSAVAMVPASVPLEVPHALRSLNALIPVALILGVGVVELIGWRKSIPQRLAIAIGFGVLWLVTTVQFWSFYTKSYQEISKDYWQIGFKEKATLILNQAEELQLQQKEYLLSESDDRFFLWLLANPEVTIKELKSLKMENYQPTQLRNIKIKP